MKLSESILPEFRHEVSLTRNAIERVPTEKFSWQPHAKSMTFGRLASHLAEIPGWVQTTIEQDALKFNTGEFQSHQAKDAAELVTMLDAHVATAIKCLEAVSDETMMGTWKMIVDGNEIISMPRIAVLRVWVLNHMIHHRGQLTVYLRENDIPVPSIYGPSADEQWGE